MSRRTLYAVLGALVLLVVGAFFGLLTGINFGGNYAQKFEFAGQRGYEATGSIGALVGAVLGAALGALAGSMMARSPRS